ncbi:MAG: type transport system permease protein [Bacillota bacterium]|nr:type transport system permease protein [Bacillota bacterium]
MSMPRVFSVKRVFSLMRQDFTTALRDNVMVYIIVAPVFMALAFKLLIPAAESSRLVFAVDRSLSPAVVDKIREYGDVELSDRAGVISRVERLDAAAGVLDDAGRLYLLFEGNEPRPLVEAYQIILENIIRGVAVADYEEVNLGAGRSIVFDLITLGLIMGTVFFAGVISGFTIVDERDTRAIQALAVSPIRVSEYAAARSLLATVLAAIVAAAASHIMVGQCINLLRLLALVALSAPLTALVGILTGLFSHNQITAIAILKIAMPAYVAIPLGAIFVPERLQFLFYALPNYWQLEALKTLYAPSLAAYDFWLSALLTLATGALFLTIAAGAFRRRVGLR